MKRATLITLYILLVLLAVLFVQPCLWGDPVPLKQSTATTVLLQQPFYDDAGEPNASLDVVHWTAFIVKGITPTALTITALGGGDNDANHVRMGLYSLELTAANTDTLGPLAVTIHDGNAPNSSVSQFYVYAANAYDSLYAGTDKLLVDVNEWRSGAIPAVNTTGVPLVDVNLASHDVLGAIQLDPNNYVAAKVMFTAASAGLSSEQIADMNTAIATKLPADFNGVGITSNNLHVHLKATDDNVVVDVNTTDVASGVAALQTIVVDANNNTEAILEHGTYGLSALQGILADANDATDLLSNGTYGLSALQTLLADANDATDLLSNGTYGLSAMQTLITDANNNTEAILEHGTYGLSAIQTLLADANDATDLLANGTYGLSAIQTMLADTNDATDLLANGTYGLSAIQTLVTDANNNTEALLGDPNEASLAADLADILAQLLLLVGDANDTDIAGAFAAIGYTSERAAKIDTITDANDTLDSATYGLSALKTLIDGLGTTTTSIQKGQWAGRKN